MNELDTHRLVKRLVAVGFSDEQAETVADVVRESRETDVSSLATKGDVTTAVAQLRADIAESTADLLKWVVGLVVLVQGGAEVALIKLLPGH